MAYHESSPWREPQRTKRTRSRTVLGALLALAVLILLAIIEIGAAAVIVGLALATGIILFIGSAISRRRSP